MNGCFFYIILTAHYIKYGSELVQILGYGITTNPKKRSKQYSDHTATEQEFCYVLFGSTNQIKSLESIVKQRVASITHKIYGQPVEWISPKANMTTDELLTLVKDTIDQEKFDIKMLHDDYLPFNNMEHHRKITVKELSINPNLYLEIL
jgi:hypothetical protein